ncbi:MAG: hypothetical protein KIC37_03705 [Coriobacteriaceae bacterium]|nr:hypothetical protein [Coriobacteriaceae bacterium]
MPAILTHDFFGQDSLGAVSSVLGFESFDEHDAFLLGNQGPDPLFYLLADPLIDSRTHDVGELMHHLRPAQLLLALHDSLATLPFSERHVAEAYAAGFLCHYLLDSTVHPLVFAEQYGICDAGIPELDRSDGGRVHAEIERDLDEAVLFSHKGVTVKEHIPWKECLRASDATLATIDKMYSYAIRWTYGRSLPRNTFTHAVKSFRLVQHLFWAPYVAKRELLGKLEQKFSHQRYSLYRAMAHRLRAEATSDFDNRERATWTDPFTGKLRCEGFWDLYRAAQERVQSAIRTFFAADFDERAANLLTGGLNFSGEVVADDLPETYLQPQTAATLINDGGES